MRAERRLLVPVEDVPGTPAAVDAAAQLARAVGGTLTLLAVAPLAAPPAPYAADPRIGTAAQPFAQQDQLDRTAQERLDELVAQVGDGIEVRGVLGRGTAGPVTVEQSETGEFDLVVVPWPDRGALGHLLHDHTAVHVLDHARLPVLVVPVP